MSNSGSPLHPLLLAAPSVAASFVVLALAPVSQRLLLMQFVFVCLACALASVGARTLRGRPSSMAVAVVMLTLAGLAAPLLSSSSGPERWVALGPVNLYVAPVVLPAFLVAVPVLLSARGRPGWLAPTAAVCASGLLALQPDASQVLAILVAVAVACASARKNVFAAGLTLALMSLATIWAFFRPDPLEPVAHVEGVFRLAFEHSMLVGAAVVVSAGALVLGLHFCARQGFPWLSAVATYYAVLFACSVAGLTPAPLIGYGAGPLLGFGLMVAMSWSTGAAAAANYPLNPGAESAPRAN